MKNFGDLIGAFMQSGMAPSANERVGHALEGLQQGGAGGSGESPGGGLLGGLLGAVQSGLSGAANNPAAAGGLGALAGALLGGGGDSVKGALGGGALAMLAGVAMKALMNGGQSGGAAGAFSGGSVPLGLKAPESPDEEQVLEHTASLILRGMMNAAKADGEIDQQEMQRIVGKLKEAGMDAEGQAWVLGELSKPLDLDALVADIPSQEAAAEVYAASLLAVEVDTPEEREYLRQLAERTSLNQAVVQYIHQTMGVAG
ncbi:MAG: tellurite resistance TerB family protein [Pseudomonadota bacterium]|nr:tellurite resistance TerB family protein [Pseudomonadota bacterium]